MSNETIVGLAVVVLLAIVVAVVVLRGKRKPKPVSVVIPPAPQRSDLLFGFYGSWGDQIAETRDFASLHWELLRDGATGAAANLKQANKTTVLDVDSCVWSGGKGKRAIRPDAEQALRHLFDTLQLSQVLHLVKFIVPCDEPNQPKDNYEPLMPAAVALVRRVAGDYPQLAGVRLGCVYAGGKPMPHLDLFDVVGFDDYDAREGIFAPGGQYDRMHERLRADQRTWIFPGGYAHQDPAPFMNFANAHPEVIAVVGFVWADSPDGQPWPGIRSIAGVREQYVAAGKSIVQA